MPNNPWESKKGRAYNLECLRFSTQCRTQAAGAFVSGALQGNFGERIGRDTFPSGELISIRCGRARFYFIGLAPFCLSRSFSPCFIHSVSFEHLPHRAYCRGAFHSMLGHQHPLDLLWPPHHVRPAQIDDASLNLSIRSPIHAFGRTTSILQPGPSGLRVTRKPLVPRLSRHSILLTQPAHLKVTALHHIEESIPCSSAPSNSNLPDMAIQQRETSFPHEFKKAHLAFAEWD